MQSLILTLLLFLTAHADGRIPFEKVETRYILQEHVNFPSCKVFEHRRLEREKVLRELKYKIEKTYAGENLSWADNYIINKLFLDENLWRDELVEIIDTWKIPAGFIQEYAAMNTQVYLEFTGDSILWRETMDSFPKEVSFEINAELSLFITHHKAYYADYCSPRSESELFWYPINLELPSTTTEQVSALLQIIK